MHSHAALTFVYGMSPDLESLKEYPENVGENIRHARAALMNGKQVFILFLW